MTTRNLVAELSEIVFDLATGFMPVGGATANRILKAFIQAKKEEAESWIPPRPRVDEVREKMARLSEAVAGEQGRLYVLIDDLDRCSPTNMVQMFEWFKNHLDTANCTYVLGLDHRMAAKAIAGHYREYLGENTEEALEYGYRYLDKLLERDYEIQPGHDAHKMAIGYLGMGQGSILDWTRSQMRRDFAGIAMMEQLVDTPVLWLPRIAIRTLDTYKMALQAILNHSKKDLSLVGNDLIPAFPLWLFILSGAHHLFSPDRVESFVRRVGEQQHAKQGKLGEAFGVALREDDLRTGFIEKLSGFEKLPWPPRQQMEYLYRTVREKTPRSLRVKL